MDVRFQIRERRRLVPQLGDPLPLLILQVLLYLPQHLVHAFHRGAGLTLHTHFHKPPAILGGITGLPSTQRLLYPPSPWMARTTLFLEWALGKRKGPRRAVGKRSTMR